MDAPHHTRLRKIISRGFTPRAIGACARSSTERAEHIVETAAAEGSGDFVEQVACELPLQAIAGLLGVPQEDRSKIFDWSNQMIGDDDPEFADVEPAAPPSRSDQVRDGAWPRSAARTRADDIVTKLIRPTSTATKLVRRRVRLLRDHARGGGQRDHPQLDHPRHDGVLRQPRPVGAVQEGAARRPRPTRSSAGPRRSPSFQRTASRTPSSAACRSRRASGW